MTTCDLRVETVLLGDASDDDQTFGGTVKKTNGASVIESESKKVEIVKVVTHTSPPAIRGTTEKVPVRARENEYDAQVEKK